MQSCLRDEKPQDEGVVMLVDERRTKLLKKIEEKGFVSIQELVESLQTSESTVRRDLEYLDETSKQVRRTRGGAAYIGESITAFDERKDLALGQKQRIARVVADLIEPHEVILLDGGTTTLEVARALVGKPLQVVTNSMPIVGLFVNQPNIELIVIGGYVYPKTGVALGDLAVAMLKNVHARRLVMSVGGITEAGLFNSNSLLVETERQMLSAAEEVIVVTDSSKFGHRALAHLAPLSSVHRMVVDGGISCEWREIVEKAGIKLTVVE
jgi:DeoR/GlpR family transcriptional regulator of sugar metabolism